MKFLISYQFHLTSFLKLDGFLIKLLLCSVEPCFKTVPPQNSFEISISFLHMK